MSQIMRSGSSSVTTLYNPLRQAAATLREMLRTQAALHLNQPAERLVARDGGFEMIGDPDPSTGLRTGTRVSYGALVAGAVDWQARLPR